MTPTESFVSHLIELRTRLLRVLLVFVLAFIALYPFSKTLYTWLAKPVLSALPAGGQMIATGVISPFFTPLEVTMLAALALSIPHTLYQIWAFVAPGLYAHEKRLIAPLVVSSTLLFFAGVAFAYYLVLPLVFTFTTGSAPEGVTVMPDIREYLDFVKTIFIAFGVAFETPIAVILLVHLGVVSTTQLREARGYVIVGAFILGAIFTPPDVISQLMLAIPLWLLYELGILIAQFALPKQKRIHKPF